VLAGSSAEAAGVELGDVLESIDDAPASKHTLEELREVFRSPSATEWKLGWRRGDERLSVTVPAKSII